MDTERNNTHRGLLKSGGRGAGAVAHACNSVIPVLWDSEAGRSLELRSETSLVNIVKPCHY